MASDTPVEVTDDNFDETLASNPLVLVDFWAEWCGPCNMVGPTVAELAKEHETLLCAKLNVDKSPKSSMKFGIVSIPTLILFKNGAAVETIIGAAPKDHFEKAILPHIG